MKLFEFKLGTKELKTLPVEVQTAFIIVSHAINELSILIKLLIVSSSYTFTSEVEKNCQSVQTLLLLKMLCLKIVEAWGAISKMRGLPGVRGYFDEATKKLPTISGEISDLLVHDPMLRDVRDKYVAHYDFNRLRKHLTNINDRESSVYLTNHTGNSLYLVSEEVLFDAIGAGTPGASEGFDSIIDKSYHCASRIMDFGQVFLVSIASRNFPDRFGKERAHEVDVKAHKLVEVSLPFFLDLEDEVKD